jgi:hypothetical protein
MHLSNPRLAPGSPPCGEFFNVPDPGLLSVGLWGARNPVDVGRRDAAARASDPINVELLGLTGRNVGVAGVPA